MLLPVAAVAATQVCAPIEWQAASFGEFRTDHAAIILPARVGSQRRPVRLQLDTGSNSTILYTSDRNRGTQPHTPVAIKGFPTTFVDLETRLLQSSAGGSMGTAGVDVFPDGFVLRLSARRLCPIPGAFGPGWDWQPIRKVNGSPVIEAQDGDRRLRLLLDTGSSAFTLLSTARLAPSLARGTELRRLIVPSFGRDLNVVELRPASPLRAFGHDLPLQRVYAFSDPDIEQQLSAAGIDGLLGLSALDGDIAFDFRRNRVGYRRGAGR